MTVVFAGGGTGGHLYPAIAIADALRPRATIAFIGSADRLETTIVPKAGYPLLTVSAHALPRRLSFDLFRAVARNVKGTFQSLALLAAARPDLVVATGGYVCFPVALAARIRRLVGLSHAPIVLLEPNLAPGVTTRLLAPIVDEIWGECGGFGQRLRAKCRPTGVPVRSSLRNLPSREAAAFRLGLDPAKRVLLAIGGSQGARAINDALVRALQGDALPPGWQVLALTGRAESDKVAAAVRAAKDAGATTSFVARPYLDEMDDAYAVADLVLARAGASTLGELAALAKPAVLVPYPFATEAHQRANAARFEAAGAALVLTDQQLASGALPAVLAAATAPERLVSLAYNARQLAGNDPLAQILARIGILV
ncbi:MAG TPA: UDP-N-acetylglucosamine--N-acetylmuramyl-(pentapeptide) pyrophosphoryl-undecaprenol N-acetylglucosamine transferase [Candidatus Cybelea sp.]|nr:UDP-N-acetylglucosamine--N-acetylmuramyl-(pentapeptide) pyrophosphoryl-undecaprenol N-acetylglucosamine transferase [Candidatus Cybelea sp.]